MAPLDHGTGSGPYALLDDLTDLVVSLDEAFSIVYVNHYALELLGYERHEVIGRPITEFLDEADLTRALEVAALVVNDEMRTPITAAIYDLRHRDGHWVPVELNGVHPATGVPEGEWLIVGRYSGDQALQNRILELITSGTAHDTDLIALIPEFGIWRHPLEQYAVLHQALDGTDQVSGTDVVSRLVRQHHDGAPWTLVRRSGDHLLAEIDDLPEPLRSDAEAAGLGTCWALAVPDPLHPEPAVLVGWSRVDGPAASVHRYALDIGARMLTLILQWRSQRVALERAAHRDPLTEVANRAAFFDALGRALAETDAGSGVGILYVDLDGFKDVNDTYGHSVGDDVLRIAAARLASAIRRGDLIGRLGGDEFAVLCPAVDDPDALAQVARRVIDDLAEPVALRGLTLEVGASIGIALGGPTVRPDELVDAADRALYAAKAGGRGRWHVADAVDPGPAPGP